MKSLFFILLVGVLYKLKLQNENNIQINFPSFTSKIIDIRNFYLIKYKKYKELNSNFSLNKFEEKIFSTLKNGISENYTVLAVGGWIRDKVFNHFNKIANK
jgi:hypothetical protein